ncbi:MAG: DUF2339 domain-containing protein [Clostridiaceae bacterium]|nr:DUF2339 domain-containing protein [Clostridiaceae bacterium]
MKDLLRKHWITLLGAIFTFMAFSYSFKYAVDNGWISDELKIGIGIMAASALIIFGITMEQKGNSILSEILNGLGVALLYTTFSFAGIYYSLWTPMTVFLAMTVVTLALAVYSFKFNFRILMNLSILGALISPIVMKSQGDQVFTLFLYLLVINSIFFFVSVSKGWLELRLIPFIGTWTLFSVYYFYFEPEIKVAPFTYAVSAFIFYIVGFLVSSWKEKKNFDGLNLYLGIANGAIFGLWAYGIMHDIISFSIILGAMGLVYLTAAAITYSITKKNSFPVVANFVASMILIILSASEIGAGSAFKPIITVFMWAFIAAIVLILGQIKEKDYLKLSAAIIWIFIGTYWYGVTWFTPIGEWFNTFIPILNWSGMAWVTLAVLGFYFSLNVKFDFASKDPLESDRKFVSSAFSVVSHLIVGGLLTFQIDNLWKEYSINSFDLWLTLSVTWGIYALLLFLWGAYSKQSFFRWFGSVVLVVVAVKTIFYDLSDSEMIYKILAMFILALITFAISYINNRWKNEQASSNTASNQPNIGTCNKNEVIDPPSASNKANIIEETWMQNSSSNL